MPFLFGDSTFIIIIPALILAFYAQIKVRGAYEKWARVRASSMVTGAQVARDILSANGINDVKVEMGPGELTDHFDSRKKVIRLSRDIYDGTSIAALGIAAHEAGHALQNAQGYAALEIRNSIFPVASLGSNLAIPLFILGLFIGRDSGLFFMNLGILAFLGAVIFQLVTLPVEFNASKRALYLLEQGGYVSGREVGAVKDVLGAAALTYVAAATMALLQLARLLMLRNSRDD